MSCEFRADGFFLGRRHKSARITTHYSGPELSSLIAAAEKICDDTKSPKSPHKHLSAAEVGLTKWLM